MNRVATFILGLGLSLSLAGQAQAVSIDFGPETLTGSGPDFLFNLIVPDSIIGDAVLSLTLNGDFNGPHEWAEIYVDNLFLGRIVNGNSADDAFNFGNNDSPDPENAAVTPVTGTTILLNADFSPLIADGLLSIEVQTNQLVSDDSTTILGNLSYEPVVVVVPPAVQIPPTSTVPEPSTMILLGTGLAGLVAWKRKKIA